VDRLTRLDSVPQGDVLGEATIASGESGSSHLPVGDVERTEAPFLELRNLRRSYGRAAVLRGLSLHVMRGEFVTILGPSGSGKSTTLNLIAGFDRPDAGCIMLAGRDITHAPEYVRGIGMVFQSYALFPHMTVAENVAFPLRVRKVRDSDLAARVQQALGLVRMASFIERYPSELSGGQAQRVAIARAIVYGPQLLLMDEPLGALDRKLRQDMQLELKMLHKELGTTLVYVTHDQEEALAMSDRIAVLNDGELVQCASPSDIYERPATPFVAGFVGETNFLQAHAFHEQGRWFARCTHLGWDIPLDGSARWRRDQLMMVAVRPEHVKVSRPSETEVCATLENVQYLGDAIKCRLRHDSILLTAKISAHLDPQLLCPGNSVAVGIDRSKARVFPDGEGVDRTSGGRSPEHLTGGSANAGP
jgi:spermidine/putrescine ABC transporter ATP-binding subunit